MKSRGLVIIITVMFCCGIVSARIITVDDDGLADFNNIQAAINDACDFDTVVVVDGIYTGAGNRDIDFLGKAITVRSENGPAKCIIDCQNSGSGFYFYDCDTTSILKGFTIRNGYSSEIFDGGAAIYTVFSTPIILNCIFSENSGHSVIQVKYWGGEAPGMYTEISNCTFTNNNTESVVYGDGCGPEYLVVKNSIIWANTGKLYDHPNCSKGGIRFETNYSILQSDWTGFNCSNNTVADPGFSYPTIGDYHILSKTGRWDSDSESWVLDSETGIAVNAGDPNDNVGQESEPNGGRINIGAYGGTVEASKSSLSPGSVISLNPLSLYFNAKQDVENPPSETLTISNASFGTVNWQASETVDWLFIEPISGQVTSSDINEIYVSIDVNGLLPGYYQTNIIVSDPNAYNSPQIVSVILDVIGTMIDLSKNQCQFYFPPEGGNPNDQILEISNSGAGVLNWLIDCDCSWLSVEPNSGSSSGNINQVVLCVDTNGLDPNSDYFCELNVIDPNAENSPKIVEVYLYPECFPSSHPDYGEWIDVGRPYCWCDPRQCHGNADGQKEGSDKIGWWYVGNGDLNIMAAAWLVKEPTRGPGLTGDQICADFAHDKDDGGIKLGYWRVGNNDLNAMAANWFVKEPTKGPGVPADCLDVP